jgi:hypothetical protein
MWDDPGEGCGVGKVHYPTYGKCGGNDPGTVRKAESSDTPCRLHHLTIRLVSPSAGHERIDFVTRDTAPVGGHLANWDARTPLMCRSEADGDGLPL